MLYAVSALGSNAMGRSRDLWFLYFYAPPDDADIQRRAGTLAIGLVLFALRVVDALDDPLIGYWSDRTRSRWGRRIPYVVAATPFMALFFVLLWFPPTEGESSANVLYLFFVLWFFHLCSTLSGGPFEALLPEIARRPDDRLSIVTLQVLFGVGGAVLGLVISGLIIDLAGFQVMAVLFAVLGLATRYVGLAGAWDRGRGVPAAATEPPRLMREVRACLGNDQFVAFLPTFILYNVGVLIMTGAMPFLVEGVLEKEDEGTMVAIINGTAIGALVLLLPLVVMLARRHGKRRVYAFGMLFGAFYFPLLFFVGFVPGIDRDLQAVAYAVPLAIPLAPLQTFPNALIADITDYDRGRTGASREAMFYSTQAFFEKGASALAPLVLAVLLTLGSSHDDPLGIRLIGPVAGVLTLVGYLYFRRYWLPDEIVEGMVRPGNGRTNAAS